MAKKCNIVFIHADQLRYDFIGANGADFIDTPNIDKLAETSVRFTNAFCTSPLCVPTRNEWLTGMSAPANGVLDNKHFHRPDLKTVPKRFYENGYFTAAIGKMHNYPWDLADGYRLRIVADDKRHHYLQDDYQNFLQNHGYTRKHAEHTAGYFDNFAAVQSELPEGLQIDVFIGNEAVDFIKNNKKEPFNLSVGFAGPHCPYDPSANLSTKYMAEDMPAPIPDNNMINKAKEIILESCMLDWCKLDFRHMTKENILKMRAHYAALVFQIDAQIGKIIQALKDTGVYDHTMIIVTSDHGDMLGDYGMPYKHLFFETSIHVPLFLHYPGQEKSLVCEKPVKNGDIIPTTMLYAGLDIPHNFDLQILPGLPVSGKNPGREYLWGATDLGMMIRTEEWKLSVYITGEMQLTNLIEDPFEQTDYSDKPECRSILKELYLKIIKNTIEAMQERNRDLLIPFGDKKVFGKRGWQRPYPCPEKFNFKNKEY